jgi:hypothetical protein
LARLNLNLICLLDNIENPPLENASWEIDCQGDASVLLSSKIRTMDTNSHCWSYAENKGKRIYIG